MTRPLVLFVDDVLGRQTDGENAERAGVCADLLLNDVTGGAGSSKQRVREPIADAVFVRGQRPLLARRGDTVENDLEGLLGIVRSGWKQRPQGTLPWSLVLLDLCFRTGSVDAESGIPPARAEDESAEGLFGLRVLAALRREMQELPVVIYSSLPRGMAAEQFSALGASGFIPKAEGENEREFAAQLSRHGLIADSSGRIVGSSIPLLVALKRARLAVSGGAPSLLVRGETGTGKELLAAYIHASDARRRQKPFVTMNAASLSPELYASTLFGHEKGGFTGASAEKTGLIVEANGGWLFLDEVGDMPAEVQKGLLRVIEEKKVRPVGNTNARMRDVDVRYVFATDRNLEGAVAGGAFAEPLLRRLQAGGTLTLPPLRERKEDIPALVEHFVRQAEEKSRAMRRDVTPAALEELLLRDWPGNIRELESVLRGAVMENPDVEFLQPIHLMPHGARPPLEPAFPAKTPRAAKPSAPTPAGEPKAEESDAIEAERTSQTRPVNERASAEERMAQAERDLDGLLRRIAEFEFEPQRLTAEQLAKRSDDIENALGALMTKYLKFALWLSKTSSSKGDAKPVLQRAVRWATGRKLSGYQPYDFVIRLSQTGPATDSLWNRDPELKELLDKAKQHRRPPKPGGRKVALETSEDARSE